MPSNDQIVLASRNGLYLTLRRDERGVSAEIGDHTDVEGASIRVPETDLARLRTWLNTGISPSTIDLVDPVPPYAPADMSGLDPNPRDLRAASLSGTTVAPEWGVLLDGPPDAWMAKSRYFVDGVCLAQSEENAHSIAANPRSKGTVVTRTRTMTSDQVSSWAPVESGTDQ